MRFCDEIGRLNLSHRTFALLTEQFIGIMNLPDSTTLLTPALSIQNHKLYSCYKEVGTAGVNTAVFAHHKKTTLTNI